MTNINIILEKTADGYSAYTNDLDGIITVGSSVSETKANMIEALDLYKEAYVDLGKTLPKVLRGEYNIKYKLDIPTFFEWMNGVMTKTGVASIAGINKDLMSQYANGIKKPSNKQLLKIENALHNFGNELLTIAF